MSCSLSLCVSVVVFDGEPVFDLSAVTLCVKVRDSVVLAEVDDVSSFDKLRVNDNESVVDSDAERVTVNDADLEHVGSLVCDSENEIVELSVVEALIVVVSETVPVGVTDRWVAVADTDCESSELTVSDGV